MKSSSVVVVVCGFLLVLIFASVLYFKRRRARQLGILEAPSSNLGFVKLPQSEL